MFTRAVARKLFTNIRLNRFFYGKNDQMLIFCRWCFDVEVVYLCKWFRIRMIEIFVNWWIKGEPVKHAKYALGACAHVCWI
ncbi:dolichyl-phosphate beta-glucosyltransferase [Prunus yedoensis var. nudiflora]|uniref:Dolichyl-phosphate beta-glucosyltransferase n=1 Tax=Prunus yedoensis var. nudiflora TaxID=2094558 RepID=A0A314YQA3_PRUYE|nr:dolichyl-phosphate beta-glucosyltransferase [Prunus yedoensis var. nudiflora]